MEHLPDGTVKRRAASFPTIEAAEDFLRDLYRKRRSGAYVAPEHKTVQELVDEWLERGKLAWSPNTVYTYTYTATKRIYPHLGGVLVTHLTAPRVQHWVDTLMRAKLSPSSILGAFHVLSGAYREAVRLGVLAAMPTTGVRLPAYKQKPIPTWTREEVGRVDAFLRDESMWRALYLLAVGTGMRPGELRALRWGDLDAARRRIVVQRTATRDETGNDVILDRTKTGDPRTVVVTKRALDALLVWRTEQAAVRAAAPVWTFPGDYVFTEPDGDFLTRWAWSKHHPRICAGAGVRPISRHQMRHTSATLEMRSGTPIKIVSERLGHTRPEFTARIYQHVSESVQEEAADALDELIFGPEDATTPDENRGAGG